MLLKGISGSFPVPKLLPNISHLLLLVLCSLYMQSCAAKSISRNLVPGNELSRRSLGLRETANKVSINEINPYTVIVKRRVCQTELQEIKFQAVQETRYETQTFDCSDEYVNYFARTVTSLGFTFLYDVCTGFEFFKDKCHKNPISYRIETTETKETLLKEVYDAKSESCTDSPVAGALVTVRAIEDAVDLTTSAEGVVSLPKQKLADLQSVAGKSPITFRYDGAEITTEFSPAKPELPNLTKSTAVNSSSGENVATRTPEADSMTVLNQEGATGKVSVSLSQSADLVSDKKVPIAGSVQVTDPLIIADQSTAAIHNAVGTPESSRSVLTVRFDSNKAAIKNEFRADLQRIAEEMKKNSVVVVVIAGHTDNIGSIEANRKVSLRRAIAVKNILVQSYGAPKERIQAKGCGFDQPIADNGTENGRALNRRTEISIITPSSGI